jgi:hypothetical protein
MHRRKTHRHRKSRKSRKSRNIFNKTLNQSVSVVKTTSKRYMPKVKSSLETVGSKMIRSGKESVPYLQRLTRKVFGKFGVKK